jgi:hypothetical protein
MANRIMEINACFDLKVCVYKMEKRKTGQENERRKDRDNILF